MKYAVLLLLLTGCPEPCPKGQVRESHEVCSVSVETHCGPGWGVFGRNCTTEPVEHCLTKYGQCVPQ